MDNNNEIINEFIENIKVKVYEIMIQSKDEEIISKAKDIIDYINVFNETKIDDRKILAQKIEISMKQAKIKNSNMESVLYIIREDLIHERISVEKAREVYEQYLILEMFDNQKC